MGKSKKKRQDFQKVKLKVGRKLSKGQNVTNASFKTRTVQVTQKLKTGEITEPSTRRKQNIAELFSQCRHYNTSVRLDAVSGLRELLLNFPEMIDQNLAAILERSSELFIDKDAVVRQGVIRLLKIYLPKVTEKQISPFFPLLCAHLCCAMTHIYDDIQLDSLLVLDILLETFPRLMVSKSNQVLSNFVDQISRKQNRGQETGSRSLTVNPNSKLSSLKWRKSVLNRLEKFLMAILENSKQNFGETHVSTDEENILTFWSEEKLTGADVYPQSFRKNWESPGFTLSTSREIFSPADQEVEKLHGFVATLVPLLIECWIESLQSKQTSGGAGNILHSENLGMISGILSVTQLLLECAGMFRDNNQDLTVSGKYLKDFQHHFLAGFPYSVHDIPSKKGDKSDKTDLISAESINLAICDIMTQLLANQQSSENPTWLQDIVIYLKDFLDGKYNPKMVCQSSKTVVRVLKRMLLKLNQVTLEKLVSSALNRYKGAHHLSVEKMVYLKFFSDVCLGDDDKIYCISDRVRKEFLHSLPGLFTLVAKSNHEMAAILASTMKKAACQKHADVLDLIGKHSKKWFGDEASQFLTMDAHTQREIFSLLYLLPTIDTKLYESLILLMRKQRLGEAELAFMLQVLQNRYKKFSQDPDQVVIYIGFLCSLLVGELKGEGIVVVYSAMYSNLGGHYIHEIDDRDPQGFGITWNRHVCIVQSVIKVLPQFDNLDQVTTVMESCLAEEIRQVQDPKQVFGICKFSESMPISISFMSKIKKLCFSVVEELENWEQQPYYPELLQLGIELLLKIPGAVKELFELILQKMEESYKLDTWYHQSFLDQKGVRHLKVCLLFLTDERRPIVKGMAGCHDVFMKIVTRHRHYLSPASRIAVDPNPTFRQLLSRLEYLVN